MSFNIPRNEMAVNRRKSPAKRQLLTPTVHKMRSGPGALLGGNQNQENARTVQKYLDKSCGADVHVCAEAGTKSEFDFK